MWEGQNGKSATRDGEAEGKYGAARVQTIQISKSKTGQVTHRESSTIQISKSTVRGPVSGETETGLR